MRTCDDFDLAIRPGERDSYHVRVASRAGRPTGTFVPPLSGQRLSELRRALENAILRARHPTRRLTSPEMKTIEALGRELHDALFQDKVRATYQASLALARSEEKGLRLRLDLPPALLYLPWELMYSQNQDDFLAASRLPTLVRYVECATTVTPQPVTPPLRLLVALSSPRDALQLDIADEKRRIHTALSDLEHQGWIKIEFVEGPDTLACLQRTLRRGPFHILHFIGHGAYDEEHQEGVLLVEDADGMGKLLRWETLARLLRGHPSLRLVILNACAGAMTSSADPFTGIATALVREGVPAVIAMQFEVSDMAATAFAEEFYRALADSEPIDAAVAEGRLAIQRTHPGTIEWATPVLFMSIPDGQIFDLSPVADDAREQAEATPQLRQEATEPTAPRDSQPAPAYPTQGRPFQEETPSTAAPTHAKQRRIILGVGGLAVIVLLALLLRGFIASLRPDSTHTETTVASVSAAPSRPKSTPQATITAGSAVLAKTSTLTSPPTIMPSQIAPTATFAPTAALPPATAMHLLTPTSGPPPTATPIVFGAFQHNR
ncbi:MAG: CHAT domain-containing protein, partial [Anaerolineae bacterium]